MNRSIIVKKADGTREAFDPFKLEDSLKRSGASKKEVNYVLGEIEKDLYQDIETSEIYKKAFSILKKTERPVATSYSLRNAVLAFGPTGFPFEKFVAKILETKGYKTEVGKMMQGKCATHEIDVLATKENKTIIVEAKFHNEHGMRSGLQTALYTKARFDDLRESPYLREEEKPDEVWLVTNTKFSKSSLGYGKCSGMNLIGWDYPEKDGNLQKLIEESALHPITALASLTEAEKISLLRNDQVLCKDIAVPDFKLKEYGISEKKHNKIKNEASLVCGI